MDRNEKRNTNMVVINTCFYNENNNQFYTPKQKNVLNNINIDDCNETCISVESCIAFTYYESNDECYIFDNATAQAPDEAYYFYPGEYQIGRYYPSSGAITYGWT